MKIRLDKFLANMGVGSRKEVKEFIKNGYVKVNGVLETSAKKNIDSDDQVTIGNEVLEYQQYVYYMLNKPKDVISATRDRNMTVLDLIDVQDQRKGLYPVGRLDIDTTGLLLITNDGKLGHELLSPKKKVDKTYIAILDKELDQSDIDQFKKGFFLEPEGVLLMPSKLEILEPKMAKVTIKEGKYHQVKRMFQKVGKEVLELKRIRMGTLYLDEELPLGAYRPLRDEELHSLQEILD